MKIDFHFHKNRFIIFDDMIFSNQRCLKTIKSNYETKSLLLHRRSRRCKFIIYFSFKNVNGTK